MEGLVRGCHSSVGVEEGFHGVWLPLSNVWGCSLVNSGCEAACLLVLSTASSHQHLIIESACARMQYKIDITLENNIRI